MARRRPTSTLFPYTTLFRSDDELARGAARLGEEEQALRLVEVPVEVPGEDALEGAVREGQRQRSEEHTSELQSHSELVCRLLLEKKKTTQDPIGHLGSLSAY